MRAAGDGVPVRETAGEGAMALDTAGSCAYANGMKALIGHPNLSLARFLSCRCC
jgi:hypothetical protein